MYMIHTQKTHTVLVFHVLKFRNFFGKPEPLYSTQYSDTFVTYTESLNMHTGQRNLQSIFD